MAKKKTTWLDQLADEGRRKRRAAVKALPPAPPAQVQECFIAIRHPGGDGDPGEIRSTFFVVSDGMLTLTNAKGKPLEGASPEPIGQADPREAARRMMRARLSQSNDDFNRPLVYDDPGWR